MSDQVFIAIMTLAGAAGGVLAWRVAERVLADREDAPDPAPDWAQYVAAAFGAIVFGFFAARFFAGWLIVPYVWFLLTTMAMTFTDVRARLIPDRISFRSLGIGAALLVIFALLDGSSARLDDALLGAVIAALIYLAIFLAGRGRSFGFGDVKLSPLLGMFTAFVAWWEGFGVSVVLGFLIGGVASLLLLVSRSKGLREHFAFGPAMVLGAYAALLYGGPILDWYVGR